MKKILLLLLVFVGVAGCSCNKNKPIKLDASGLATQADSSAYLYREYSLLSYELADMNEYNAKAANKDDFVLFVYAEGCYGCSLLAPALKDYVEEESVGIYTLDYAKISGKGVLYENGVSTTPYLLIIDDGEIAYKELLKLSNDKAKNKETVKKWMEEHVEWGNK